MVSQMDPPAGRPPDDLAPKSYASALTQPSSSFVPSPKPIPGSFKGEISGFFPPELIVSYARPFSRAVVGKFSKGRPSMNDIRTFLKAQDFCGPFSVGLINSRHILIRFDQERDFHRCYSKSLWYVRDLPMRVFKWNSDFHPNRESSIVPIWFKFQDLPIHFFNRDALFFLGSLFGVPLRMDTATASLARPSVARLQVEIDLKKEIPSRLWINLGENKGFWQYFQPDGPLPSYCNHCWHLGHSDENCNIKHPELKQSTNNEDLNNNKGNTKPIYRVLQKSQPENSSRREENEIRATKMQPSVEDIPAGKAIIDKVTATEEMGTTVNANGNQVLDKGKAVVDEGQKDGNNATISNRPSNRFETVEADTAERNVSISNLSPNRFDCLSEEDKGAETVEEQKADREGEVYECVPDPLPEEVTTEVSAAAEFSFRPVKLNVDATAWHPQYRQLPPSFGPLFEFNAPDEYGSWRTIDSAEEEMEEEVDGEESMEDYQDSRFIRDDLYLEKRKNRKSKREREHIQSRRGRTYSDIVHPMTTRSKTFE